jgi:hypothetical protein
MVGVRYIDPKKEERRRRLSALLRRSIETLTGDRRRSRRAFKNMISFASKLVREDPLALPGLVIIVGRRVQAWALSELLRQPEGRSSINCWLGTHAASVAVDAGYKMTASYGQVFAPIANEVADLLQVLHTEADEYRPASIARLADLIECARLRGWALLSSPQKALLESRLATGGIGHATAQKSQRSGSVRSGGGRSRT